MSHSLNSLFQHLSSHAAKSEERHTELSRKVLSSEHINTMNARLDAMERLLQGIQRDVEKNREVQGEMAKLKDSLKETHSTLVESLQGSLGQSQSSFLTPVFNPVPLTFSPISRPLQQASHGFFPFHRHRRAVGSGRVVRHLQAPTRERAQEISVNCTRIKTKKSLPGHVMFACPRPESNRTSIVFVDFLVFSVASLRSRVSRGSVYFDHVV